jgi:hypothetical protein
MQFTGGPASAGPEESGEYKIMPFVDVTGWCPMGCGRTLHLNSDSGLIACLNKQCPHPMAVSTLIAKSPPTDHLVEIGDGWAIEHPLWERITDRIFDCPLGIWLAAQDGAPVSGGFYRVKWVGTADHDGLVVGGWHFEETGR